MHLSNAISVADNYYTEGIHNIIVNVLQMILVDAILLSPHAFPQLKPNIPLEVNALINS